MNQKPMQKLEYVLSADHARAEMQKNASKRKAYYREREGKPESFDDSDVQINQVTELDEVLDDVQFKEVKSSSSCKISDIQSIMFGGLSSRFWMLRKHINLMEPEELKKLPFYSWNCLTLCLPQKDVDLVIKDEKDMEKVMKYLVY